MSSVSAIFDKISSKDKDLRYMATSDLLNGLQKESFAMNAESEKKVCQVVLQQMEDASGDISNLAVKCLVPLAKRATDASFEEIVNGLCDKLLNSAKEPQRDIGSIGLKTVVSEISSTDTASGFVKKLTPKLITYLNSSGGIPDVKSECLDIIQEEAQRFGIHMTSLHEPLKDCLLPQLCNTRAGLRKRAILCTASIAASMPDVMLVGVCEHAISGLADKTKKPDITRTYVQMIGALSRSVGYRFGKYLPAVVPVLMEYCNAAAEGDDEMRENVLQGLESFVLRCPREVTPFLEAILAICLEYLKYDPNFSGDADEEDEDMECSDDEDADEESEDEYSDDEDSSWKTRRAAARCLTAIITSRPELLGQMYAQACPLLISRLREREESVKSDIFNVLIDLLRTTGAASKKPEGTSALTLLSGVVGNLIKESKKQVKEKSLKTKVAVFLLWKELVMALPNGLQDHIAGIVPSLEKALSVSVL
eukprot:gene27737-34245_t